MNKLKKQIKRNNGFEPNLRGFESDRYSEAVGAWSDRLTKHQLKVKVQLSKRIKKIPILFWLNDLKSIDFQTRSYAIHELMLVQDAAEAGKAFQALKPIAFNNHSNQRNALIALSQLGRAFPFLAEKVLPILINAFKSKDDFVRMDAARSLYWLNHSNSKVMLKIALKKEKIVEVKRYFRKMLNWLK